MSWASGRPAIRLALAAALALGACAVLPSPQGTAGAVTPAAKLVIRPAGMTAEEVSFDGRFLFDEMTVLDMATGGATASSNCPTACLLGFVRESPNLLLEMAWEPRTEDSAVHPRQAGVFLRNATTGVRQRIDTDAAGLPLAPSWANPGSCSNRWCDNFFDFPEVRISKDSVSRDGTKVAFCANYTDPKVPSLYVKDLSAGKLKKTKLRCPIITGVESTGTRPPQISDDGRVVHVQGDLDLRSAKGLAWTADQLYFTSSARVRKVPGWGSMTRDGQTIFVRRGVPAAGKPVPRSAIKVGAYAVATGRTEALSGRDKVYGIDMGGFSAFDVTSRRGRYVINSSQVLDRRTGTKKSLAALLAKAGLKVASEPENLISGNGKVLVVAARRTTPSGEASRESVTISGW